jgi:hypothetical protein
MDVSKAKFTGRAQFRWLIVEQSERIGQSDDVLDFIVHVFFPLNKTGLHNRRDEDGDLEILFPTPLSLLFVHSYGDEYRGGDL